MRSLRVPVAAAAAAVLAALTAAATGGALQREAIGPSDTVLGDIAVPGEIDEYTFDALLGGTVSMDVRNAPPSGWKASVGVATANYDRLLAFYGLSPSKIRSEAVPFTGTYRLLVSGRDASVGGYKVRIGVDPGRAFAVDGVSDAQPDPLRFGAVPDSDVVVSLKWKGPAPVTLTSLTGPAGDLTSATPPKTKRTSSVQSGFRTTDRGDHALTVAVPAGTKSWSAQVRLKPPKREAGTTLDFRTEHPDPPPTLDLLNVGAVVAIVVEGERGAANEVLLRSSGPGVTGLVLDNRTGGCSVIGLDVAEDHLLYQFRCTAGWYAEVEGVVREGGFVTGFDVPVIRTPTGTGSARFEDISYDAGGRVSGWRETRTFDASGREHVLEVADIVRRGDGTVLGYTVVHTAPGGVVRTYDYAPIRTP